MTRCLNFRHVEVIRAVVQTGTVTGAAGRLHVTQPAVSNILRDAEDRLGFALFERVAGRITPTKKAAILVAEIERAFTGLDAINEVCGHLVRNENRRIAIASTPSWAASVLPPVIRQYRDRYPDVRFSLVARSSNMVQSMVVSQKADIGFGLDVPAIPGVRQEVLVRSQIRCIVNPDHPLAAKAQVGPRDLHDYDMISFSHLNEGTEDTYSDMFEQAASYPESVVDCATSLTTCSLVESGVGVAQTPPTALGLFRQARIRIIPFVPSTTLNMCAYVSESHDTSDLDLAYMITLAREHAARLEADINRLVQASTPAKTKARVTATATATTTTTTTTTAKAKAKPAGSRSRARAQLAP